MSKSFGDFVPCGDSDGVLGVSSPFCDDEKMTGCDACCAPADRTIATAMKTGSGSFKLSGRKFIFRLIR